MVRFFHSIHKFLGILIGIPLFISGLTGAIYVWQPEITKASYSGLYVDNDGENEISAKELVELISGSTSKQIHKLYFPERERGSYCVTFTGDNNFYFYHPHTGEMLGKLKNRRGWIDIVLKLHTFSYLKNGGLFIAWVSILLAFFLITSGILLWKPGNRKLNSSDFLIEKRFWKVPQIYLKSHKIIGIYLSLIIVLIAFSGASFEFRNEYRQIIGKITREQTSVPTLLIHNTEGPLMNIEDALKIVDENFNFYVPRSIILSNNKSMPAYISWMKSRKINRGKRDRPFVYINPVTKKLIYIYTPAQSNAADTFINDWIPQLHFGEWGGIFSRILNFVASLGLTMLVLTGYYIFYRMLKRKQRS